MAIPRRDLPSLLANGTRTLHLISPEPWTVDALCAQTDPEAFFPEKGGSTREAKAVCARCTVSAECLTYALDHEERFGIWGGVSERDRRKLRATAVLGPKRRSA